MKRQSPAAPTVVSVFLLCVAWMLPAAANTVVCVPFDMTLVAALNQAQTTATTIHLIQGTHDLANTVWHRGVAVGTVVPSGSQLIGGYTAACATRNIAAGNTKLIDSVPSGFDTAGTLVKGDLTIEGITFELQNGLTLYAVDGPGGTIMLLRDAFLDTPGNLAYVAWAQSSSVDGTISIVDSLYANNQYDGCFVNVAVYSGTPNVDFINNTVVDNSGNASGACFGNYGLGSGSFRFYNNIFYGTTGSGSADLYIDTTQSKLVDNIIGIYDPTSATPGSESGTHSYDPKLNASYKPIEAPPSPVINAGSNNPPGGLPATDLNGGARLIGARVDRGAYESSLDFTFMQSVTKTADDGTAGTLRTAIANVNSNGSGKITFDIGTGCGPHVITLDHTKPDLMLTVDSMVDGYTNGAIPNGLDPGDDATICVILETDGFDTRGLVVPSSVTDGTNVTIQGLGFSGFTTTAIDLQGGSQHVINGNHFGGTIGGHAMAANGYDMRLGASTHDNTVGSDDAADRNIVGAATNSGIVIASGSTNNQIVNNYIGVGWNKNASAFTTIGNGARGIYVAGDNTAISGNLIGNNTQAGIVLDSLGAHGNLIVQNFIGQSPNNFVLANGASGIHLIGDSGVTGDAPNDNTIRLNTIASNTAQGVLIDVGQRNKIRKNSIYANGMLGIDLGAVGPAFPQSNDAGPHLLDEANRSQNFPILTSASGDLALGNVAGSLATTAGDHTVDFYVSGACDASGYGQGGVWLGAATVLVIAPVDTQATKAFVVQINSPSPTVLLFDGDKITATATDSLGNTSEFSPCVTYSNDGIYGNGFERPPA